MEKETIENIFTFLKTRERKEIPQEWINFKKKDKLIKELEDHPNGIQYRYEGNLNLSYSNITKLPNDLYVSGELDLRGCKQLEKLPNNLYVGIDLYIGNTPLADKYTDEEIIKIVESTRGQIEGQIYRQ